MKVSIKSDAQAKQVTISLNEIDLEKMKQGSFYQAEKQVQQIVNDIGQELTGEILQSRDLADQRIELDGRTWYRKESSAGHYQRLYGEVIVSRHLYQRSAGGATRCPMEEACGLSFGAATNSMSPIILYWLSRTFDTAGKL